MSPPANESVFSLGRSRGGGRYLAWTWTRGRLLWIHGGWNGSLQQAFAGGWQDRPGPETLIYNNQLKKNTILLLLLLLLLLLWFQLSIFMVVAILIPIIAASCPKGLETNLATIPSTPKTVLVTSAILTKTELHTWLCPKFRHIGIFF